jgi:DNA-binding NarL/FixJ family response regulator
MRRTDIAAAVLGDDALARAGLAATLASAGVTVLREVAVHDLARVAASGAQLAVWDAGGRVAMPEALDREVGLPIVALVDDPQRAVALLAAGARGVLRRDAPAARIVTACRAVLDGLLVVDAALAAAMRLPAPVGDGGGPLEPLTAREAEVLQLLARGFANKRIAAALGISEHTAKFHVNAVLGKLGAHGRTDAVVRAARLGLVVL